LFAVAGVSLTMTSAGAFSQESGGTGGDGNSTFADPDEQVNIFGYGAGPQQYGSNGAVQFNAQPGQSRAFRHFLNDSLTSPPDLLSRPQN
jgi:hypothetical protein